MSFKRWIVRRLRSCSFISFCSAINILYCTFICLLLSSYLFLISFTVIPSLLLPLGNSNRLIRKGSLTCLKALYEASSHSLDQQPLFHFLEALVHSVPELETDNLGISLFVEKYFCQRSSRSISGRTKKIKQTETIKGREVVLESICGCFSSVFCSGYEEPPYHILKQFLEVFRKAEHEVCVHVHVSLIY